MASLDCPTPTHCTAKKNKEIPKSELVYTVRGLNFYNTVNSRLENTPLNITDTHYYKQELHPQPQTIKKCMKTTPTISDSHYDRIADASGGPK